MGERACEYGVAQAPRDGAARDGRLLRRDLEQAAGELVTLATFVRLVRELVGVADGTFPTGEGAALALWDRASREAASFGAFRDRHAEAAGLERWLRLADDADVIEFFESRHGDDPVTVLLALTDSHAVRYWDALSQAAKNRLIDQRPEGVVRRVLDQGGGLNRLELDRLLDSNSYPVFEAGFAAEFDAAVEFRILTIETEAGVSLMMTKNSNGTVDVAVVGSAGAGAGASVDLQRHIDLGGGMGLFGESVQRFHFQDESEARIAIDG